MKRIVGAALAAVVIVALANCATKPTGDARDTASYKQNEELGLPAWCGNQFKSGYNKNGFYWKGPVDEKGFFASGQAKYADVNTSTTAADLEGKAQIAFYVKQEINAIAQQEAGAAGSDGETQKQVEAFQSSVASIKISGIMRVDRFIARDGTVYVLMFVPEAEIKKSLPSDSEFAKRVMERYIASLDDENAK